MILERLTKREKIFFTATVIIVIAAFGYNFILEPLVKKWGNLNAEIAQKSLLLDKNLHILEREPWIREEFTKYAQSARSAGNDEEVIAVLLNLIEEKANT